MYHFQSSSSHLRSLFREDINSLLGNAGKTLFSHEPVNAHFSFGDSFWTSIQKLYTKIVRTKYFKPLTYFMISLAIIISIPTETSFAASDAPTKWQTFTATAYYSPVPWQQYYYRGSYDAEIRLNGNGVVGASGTPVFTGMLAAPKSYPFGTRIFFEWLGLGEVQDRGGAIKSTAQWDRIDIWMGHGDEGLRRTLAWWRRKIRGAIIADTSKRPMMDISAVGNGNIDLSRFAVSSWSAQWWLSSQVIDMFADIGYTPKDNRVRDMVVQFQLDHQVIPTATSPWAGIYGPKTTAALAKAHKKYTALKDHELKAIKKARTKLSSLDNGVNWQKKHTLAKATVVSFGDPDIGQRGQNIRNLQVFLSENKMLRKAPNGRMDFHTRTAIRRYQRAYAIRPTGRIDSATQIRMIDDIIAKK